MRILRKESVPLATTTANYDEYLFRPNTSFGNRSSVPGEFDVKCNINSFGYRGKDFTQESSADVVRVLLVGDSFTFGVGAEEDQTIAYLFEEKLREKGMACEVINAGMGHTSPIKHLKNIRDIHLQYDPDLVILLYDFSDMNDDWYFERQALFDTSGNLLRFDKRYVDGKLSFWNVALEKSALARYLNNKLVKTFKKIKTLGLKEYVLTKLRGKRAKSQIANVQGVDTIAQDHYIMLRGREREALIRKHWQRSAKYLTSIKDLLADRNIPFVLGAYPYGVQISGDEWGEGRVFWGFEQGKRYDDTLAFDLLQEYADDEEILFLNSLQAFIHASNSGVTGLYFDHDGHLSPKGNQVLSNFMASNEKLLLALNRLNSKNVEIAGYE